MKAYNNLNQKRKLHLPITEKISKGIFSLPLYPKLKYDEVYKITKVLKTVLKTI